MSTRISPNLDHGALEYVPKKETLDHVVLLISLSPFVQTALPGLTPHSGCFLSGSEDKYIYVWGMCGKGIILCVTLFQL